MCLRDPSGLPNQRQTDPLRGTRLRFQIQSDGEWCSDALHNMVPGGTGPLGLYSGMREGQRVAFSKLDGEVGGRFVHPTGAQSIDSPNRALWRRLSAPEFIHLWLLAGCLVGGRAQVFAARGADALLTPAAPPSLRAAMFHHGHPGAGGGS